MLKFSKYFVGILFIISGLIKLNDPTGFSIKLEEYFVLFGLTFLNPLVLTLSVFICALEVILGVALLLSLRNKLTAWLLLILIVFFTILTGYSAISGKVTDCGCFGDAIKLTPWQSFIKDVILLVLILIIFKSKEKLTSAFSEKRQITILLSTTLLAILFGVFCLFYLPVVDFLPYKIGNNIPEQMKVPAGSLTDSFTTVMTYEKEGLQKEFDLKNYPWQDSTWKWVKTENKLIRAGVKPKIKDLRIADADGNDYSEDFINYAGARLWVVCNELEKANPTVLASISALAVQLEKEYKINTIGLTASSDIATENIRHESNIMFSFYYCDATTLKTMVRSNPGVLLIQNGVIINKWAFRALPSAKAIATQINK